MTRAEIVAAAHDSIVRGSQSFAAASRLFDRRTRERVWLLYCWCRAADDLTDGQELGHGAAPAGGLAGQARLEALSHAALAGEAGLPLPFAALGALAAEVTLPRRLIDDHLAGFARDALGWRPASEDDLLTYCYQVAGSVGCLMALVMGVAPSDAEMLDRACDLGLAFQLANITRDIVPDWRVGRCYLPQEWLAEAELSGADLADPRHRPALAALAARLVAMARAYRASARVGAARLAFRARLAVLAADAVYGRIGDRVVAKGANAWDARVSTGAAAKGALIAGAMVRALCPPRAVSRAGLWTRSRATAV